MTMATTKAYVHIIEQNKRILLVTNGNNDGRSPFSHVSYPNPNPNSYPNLTLTLNLTVTEVRKWTRANNNYYFFRT